MELADGEILINGQKPTKTIRRRIGYVLQEDVFFSHLTVNQTLKVIFFWQFKNWRQCSSISFPRFPPLAEILSLFIDYSKAAENKLYKTIWKTIWNLLTRQNVKFSWSVCPFKFSVTRKFLFPRDYKVLPTRTRLWNTDCKL